MTPETEKNELNRAMDRITRYLAARDHSVHELKQKLKRSFSDEIVAKALHEAESNGWLPSPEQVRDSTVRSLTRKLKSQRYIEGQLRKRQLPAATVSENEEIEKILELLSKKFPRVTNLKLEEKAKVYRFLRYRGFADRYIRQALLLAHEKEQEERDRE